MGLYEHFPYSNYHELNLDWLLSKVKELQTVIDEINAWKETFSAQINAQISNLISEVNEEFTQLKADIEKEFTDYRNETDDKFEAQRAETNKQFASLTDAVNTRLTAFDGRIGDIESKLHDIETNLPTLVHVTNPFTGMSDSIQNVINALADTQRSDALTASAYDALNLTASAYDAKNVSAADYDFHGQSFIG
jgi:archaellum component FlaC